MHVYGATSPNVPQGGTIALGTYTLTDYSVYDPTEEPVTSVAPGGETLVVNASTLDILRDKGGGNLVRLSGTWTTNGTTLTTRYTCKSPASNGSEAQSPYTATATTLTLFFVAPAFSVEVTYTKK